MTEHSLYGGDILLEYDDAAHEYFVGDEKIPNVSGVVGVIEKPNLGRWRLSEAIRFLYENLRPGVEYDEVDIADMLRQAEMEHILTSTRATDIGSIIHDWIERYIYALADGEELPPHPVNKEAQMGTKTFLTWIEKQNVQFLETERKVFSREHQYTGTMDALVRLESGEIELWDFKSSKRLYPEHGIQIAAYAHAYTEETGQVIDRLRVIRIPKDRDLVRPRISSKEFTNIGELFNVFNACLTVYRWKNS